MNELISADSKVIPALVRILSNNLSSDSQISNFYQIALNEIITLTESKYGLIGEILFEDIAFPYLHVLGLEDRNWSSKERSQFSDKLQQGINFRKLDGLFGQVRSTTSTVISQEKISDALISGWPVDHPEFKNVIAIPLHGKKTVIGILMLANSNIDYTLAVENDLLVILQVLSNYIEENKQYNKERFINKNEDYYYNLIDGMPGAVCRMQIDDDLYILDASHQIKGITGYAKDDYLSNDRISFGSNIIKDDRVRVLTTIKEASDQGRTYDLEYEIINRSGEIRWVLDRGYGLYHSDGKLCYISSYLMDITEQKKASIQKTEINERLLQAQQMQTLSQMASGVSHDLNNMLASMMGYSELCIEMLEENEHDKIGTYLENILLAGKRARDVVASIETFSKSGEGGKEYQELVVTQFFEELKKVLSVMLPKTVTLSFDEVDETLIVGFDPVAIQRIIIVLCMNSNNAMDGNGVISMSARKIKLDNVECESCHDLFSGTYIEVCLKDTGKGMPAEVKNKMFDPFFTTGQMGNGAGMGLSIAHGAIHSHNGHIRVISEEGKGCTVKLYLKLVE